MITLLDAVLCECTVLCYIDNYIDDILTEYDNLFITSLTAICVFVLCG